MKTRIPTSQEIEELVAFLPRLYEPGFSPVKKWHGGNKDDDGVITMPFPEYEPIVRKFFRVASSEHWTDYDYQTKFAGQMLNDDDGIKTADLAQIKLCTQRARQIYKLLGAEEELELQTPYDYHRFGPARREEAIQWLGEALKQK